MPTTESLPIQQQSELVEKQGMQIEVKNLNLCPIDYSHTDTNIFKPLGGQCPKCLKQKVNCICKQKDKQ